MRAGYHPAMPDRGGTLKEQGFYKTPAWRKIRLQALQRDHYICQLRLSSHCTGIATEVYHIQELESRPDLGLSLDNLTSCCWYCHEETKTRKTKPKTITGVRVINITDGSDDES